MHLIIIKRFSYETLSSLKLRVLETSPQLPSIELNYIDLKLKLQIAFSRFKVTLIQICVLLNDKQNKSKARQLIIRGICRLAKS